MFGVSARAAILAIALAMCCDFARPAAAQSAAEVEAFCQKASSPEEKATCMTQRLQITDAELKRVYRLVLASIDAKVERPIVHRRDWRRAVQEAQRHWRAWVIQDCRAVVGWEMSGAPSLAAASAACELERVASRIVELRGRYGVK